MADELFDAVLSGSMNENKEEIAKVKHPEVTQTKVKEKESEAKDDAGGNPAKPKPKLSIYVGNFPWVSITVCELVFTLALLIVMLLKQPSITCTCTVCFFSLHMWQNHVIAEILK